MKKIIVSNSYEDMSAKAAEEILSIAHNPLFCAASGDTPAGLYKELVKSKTEFGQWSFVGLDEWAGMNGNDHGSCRYYIDQQLFHPLKIKEDKIAFFDGRAKDPVNECERIESFIQQHKGIDIAVLGLGTNGHIGMNEPGTPITSRSHVSTLAAETQRVGQKYFNTETVLDKGLTLGIATILEAKHIFLLVNSINKAKIVEKMINEPVSEQLPCTLLRNHAGLRIYLDNTAASLIR